MAIARARGGRMFRSLRAPNFRRWFAGSAVSVCGTWMQRVAQDWLVLQLSHSGVALGVATALQFAPVLLGGVWGGVVVDRVDRKRLLVATQSASGVLAAGLGVLALTGVVTLWMVYALALALGVVTVFDTPGRQVFLTELVGTEDLVNSQALYSSVHNAGRLVGPALAGAVIGTFGVGWAFVVNAASFAAVLVALQRVDRAEMLPARRPARGKGQVAEGLRHVWHHPDLRSTVLAVLVIGIFAQNFRVVLPLLAQRTFHGGAQTYGYLTAALGLGAVVGALGAATSQRSSSRSVLVSCAALAATNVAVAVSPTFPVALATLVGLGVANIVVNTLARTLVLTTAGPGMQGRVMAIHSLVFLGSTPIGGPLVGWMCSMWGPRSGLVAAAASALVAMGAMLPAVRAAVSRPEASVPVPQGTPMSGGR